MQLGDERGVKVALGSYTLGVAEIVHVDDGTVALELAVEETAEVGDGLSSDVYAHRGGLLLIDIVVALG